jgi:hypothetical protein
LFLALLHQRRNPTLLSGSWDFVGVLLGLSGFLLVGTSIFLLSFDPAGRDILLHGADVRRIYSQGSPSIVLLWFLFYVSMSFSFGFLIWQRRLHSVIYNISPAEFEDVLGHMVERLHLQANRRGKRWYLYRVEQRAKVLAADGESSSQAIQASALVPRPAGQLAPEEGQAIPKATLLVDGSSAMRTVSIYWRTNGPEMRQELQAELARDLDQYTAAGGAAAGWFITIATAMFVLMIIAVGGLLVLIL